VNQHGEDHKKDLEAPVQKFRKTSADTHEHMREAHAPLGLRPALRYASEIALTHWLAARLTFAYVLRVAMVGAAPRSRRLYLPPEF